MDFCQAIRDRRSIRKYLDAPVDEATLRDIVDTARWAPSWGNTQGWRVFVVTGPALEAVKRGLQARVDAKTERHFDITPPKADWPPELLARIEGLKAARASVDPAPGAGSAGLFGAPCLVLLAADARLQPEYACYDAGALAQTLCLAAHAKGLGTCVMALAVAHTNVLRQAIPGTEGLRFVIGIVLGHPDLTAPANNYPRQRVGLDEIVAWVR